MKINLPMLLLSLNVDMNMDMDKDLNQRFPMGERGTFVSPGNIWQFLELFLVVTTGGVLLASTE